MHKTDHNLKSVLATVTAILLALACSSVNIDSAVAASVCEFTVVTAGNANNEVDAGVSIGGSSGSVLEISGNPTITGSCGGIHTNGDLKVAAQTTVDQCITYSGSLVEFSSDAVCGSCSASDCGAQVTAVTPPVIDPDKYRDYVDYQLRADGWVYQNDGFGGWNKIADGSNSPWNGWDFSSPKWVMGGSGSVNGSLFVEGDVVVGSNPGSAADPWETSIIATGFIEISGNPTMVTNPHNHAAIAGLLFVAGTDLKINGNADQDIQGIMAAHEQVDISGNPELSGCIIAEDAPNTGDSPIDKNAISGDMVLHCTTCTLPTDDQVITITEPF